MRRLIKIVIAVALLAALTGHILYWYLPRERPAVPNPDGAAYRLLTSGDYDACLWLPYPHQNLATLADAVDDAPGYLAAVAGVANLPPPVLPSFGPFTVPPAREVVACSDLSGRRFLLAARVYPTLAAVARLAGSLAGNPWLSGGEVVRSGRDGAEEKTYHVAWRDGLWMVSSGEAPAELPPAGESEALPESLGVLRLEPDASDFPAGDYVLRRSGDDLVATLLGGGPAPKRPGHADTHPPILLAVAGPAWPASEEKPLPPAAFVLDESEDGIQAGSLGRLPGAAVLNAPGGGRWTLPTQGIAGLVSKRLPKGHAAGWEITALDQASLRRAKRLAPRLAKLTPPDGQPASARLVLGLWCQPREAHRLVVQTRTILEEIPLVPRRQVRRWQAWETLLAPVTACEEISLAATQSPGSFEMRLAGCR